MAGCSGIAAQGPTISPSISAFPTTSPSPTATPTPSATAWAGVVVEQRCSVTPVLDGRPVAIASLTPNDFSPPNVLLDLIDPSVPRQLCTYRGLNWTVRFIGASQFAYAAGTDGNPSDGVDGTFDILAATNKTLRRWQNGGFGAYTFAWSRDGALAYILAAPPGPTWGAAESWEIHLVKQGQDHTLGTLPGVPARGGSEGDDLFLAFSPDGQYLALDETFTRPAAGTKSGDGGLRLWRVSDASLLAPPLSQTTAAVWVQDSLFYWDQAGVHRWDVGGATTLILPGVRWLRPRASPDGKWIAYSVRDSTGLPHVNVLNVATASSVPVSSGGRDGAIFLTPTILWDNEQRPCDAKNPCGMNQSLPTGLTFLYDVATRQEWRSAITAVTDVWPRMD
jgi:hypothetical protein